MLAGLGPIIIAAPGARLRITNNQADPARALNCEAILAQALSNPAHTNAGRVYVYDRLGVRLATLAVPTANTIPSFSATVPGTPGGLNAADFYIDADIAGDGVDASYLRP